MSQDKRGLYGKYKVEKTDGSPLDPEAIYFTIRLDTDPHARRAIKAYIASLTQEDENRELVQDLIELIIKIEGAHESNPFGIDPIIHHLRNLFENT